MNLHSDKKITKLSFLKSLKKFFFFHDFVSPISTKRSANRFVPCGASSFQHGTSFE